MFKIVKKREVVPNVHELVIDAPAIAKKSKAGQFVILMVDEKSERVPYTLADWDAAAGTITLIVLEMGQSSGKLVLLNQGDSVAHVVGPLGTPLEVAKVGTVALVAGCYGIGAIHAPAKALKAAGNHVVSIAEARSHYLHYYGEELRAASNELVETMIDGSGRIRGHAVDWLKKQLAAGRKFDLVVAVGCPFMMMLTAKETQPHGVKTLAALNPIMVDGTGMCGACRVGVGTDTKFACIDGPFFDAHKIDWNEVNARRAAYSLEETNALELTEPRVHGHHQHSEFC